MKNPHFYLGTRKKEDTLYLFYNKALNIYKFGITAKPIKERIENYCKNSHIFNSIIKTENGYKYNKYNFSINDINLIFCEKIENCQEVEKELIKITKNHKVRIEGCSHPFRDHFYKSKLDDVIAFLKTHLY